MIQTESLLKKLILFSPSEILSIKVIKWLSIIYKFQQPAELYQIQISGTSAKIIFPWTLWEVPENYSNSVPLLFPTRVHWLQISFTCILWDPADRKEQQF